jgi:hypothetical protein
LAELHQRFTFVPFGTSLSGVDAIRIDFFPTQENNYAGLGEIDDRSGTGLLLSALLGCIGLLASRRREA